MRLLGPLVCSTSLPVTATLASASASVVTSEPSTTISAGKLTSEPGSPSSFSTSTTSPTATLYCLPPVLPIAYADTDAPGCSMVNGGCVLNRAVRGRHRRPPALAAGRCIGYVVLLDGRAPAAADAFLWWACRARRRSPSTPWCGPG